MSVKWDLVLTQVESKAAFRVGKDGSAVNAPRLHRKWHCTRSQDLGPRRVCLGLGWAWWSGGNGAIPELGYSVLRQQTHQCEGLRHARWEQGVQWERVSKTCREVLSRPHPPRARALFRGKSNCTSKRNSAVEASLANSESESEKKEKRCGMDTGKSHSSQGQVKPGWMHVDAGLQE